LNNALTERFPGKKVGVPPDCEAFCLKIRGKIPRELNMRLRVTDEYVCHQTRSNQDDWTSTIPALQVTWLCRTRKTDSLNSRNFFQKSCDPLHTEHERRDVLVTKPVENLLGGSPSFRCFSACSDLLSTLTCRLV
jgi:hypothetical protein